MPFKYTFHIFPQYTYNWNCHLRHYCYLSTCVRTCTNPCIFNTYKTKRKMEDKETVTHSMYVIQLSEKQTFCNLLEVSKNGRGSIPDNEQYRWDAILCIFKKPILVLTFFFSKKTMTKKCSAFCHKILPYISFYS